MDLLRVLLAVVLPWAAGAAWLLALARGTGRGGALQAIAYGYVVGMLELTLLMQGAGALGARLSFGWIAVTQAALVAGGVGAYWLQRGAALRVAPPAEPAHDVLGWRWLAFLAAALIALRIGTLAVEVLLRPLFPWDAWTQWATKARVWSGLHLMAPFITYGEWLSRTVPGYVDTAPHYPPGVPVAQAWVALALGRWNDVLINVPWLAAALALCAGVYAQLRATGVGRSWAAFAAYAVVSMPLLDVHVALAGYADLHVALAFVLALAALVVWERTGDPLQGAYFVGAVALLPLLKVPGFVWAATLLLGALVATFGGTARRVVSLTLATGIVALLVATLVFRNKLVAVAGRSEADVAQPLAENLFAFDNWHLLWYLVPVVALIGWRDAWTRMRGSTVTLLAGAAFLTVTFGFTRAANWIADYTTVNRALLHIAPAAAFFAALLAWDWLRAAPAAPGAPVAEPVVAPPDAIAPPPQ